MGIMKKPNEPDMTETVQFRIEPELLKVIDDWCQENGRTRSWIIRRALIFTFMKELGVAKIRRWYDKLTKI